jgi:DNA-binding transcriptional MerR regulator
MSLLNISEAARVIGKSRQTLHKYLKNGTLSSVSDETGQRKVDTAELLRVFGELTSKGENDIDTIEHQITPELDSLQARIHQLEEKLNTMTTELYIAKEREIAAKEQEQWYKDRIVALERLALPQGDARKGLWARLFGE